MKLSLQVGKRSLNVSTGGPGQDSAPPIITGRTLKVGTGRAMPGGIRFGQRMYQGAQVTRLTADWPITLTSANAEILVSAIGTRSRLRQLERDDDYMRQMLALLENNVVGDHGITLRMKLKKADGSYDQDLIHVIRAAWHDYLEEENCTVMGNMDGVKVQRLATRCLARDGALLLRIHTPYDNEYNFALEPIEIDRLDHFWNRPAVGTANEIQFGVEVNKFKKPVAYWILTRHPGDVFAWRTGPKYRERVPAEDIIAIWDVERAGQWIGMPLWPSIGNRLNHLHRYEESEAIAARAAAAKGGWFEKTNANGEYTGPEDEQGNKISDTEPGQWEELPIGWKAVQNDPTHPTDAYPYFIKGQLRGAAAGANLPYNSVANDLEGVNYSSIRAGLLDARDSFKWLQRLLTKKLMRRWFREWLPIAIMSGKIPGVQMVQMQQVKAAAQWQGRRWPWIDPLKDVQAALLAIGGGLDSRRNVIAEDGGDIDEVFEEQKEDRELAEQHGLDFSGAEKPVIESGPENPEAGGDKPKKVGIKIINGNGANGHSRINGI